MGGGLAAAQAVITSSEGEGRSNIAITFNSSGLHFNTVNRGFGASLDNVDKLVYALNTHLDPLTRAQANKELIGGIVIPLTELATDAGIDLPFNITPDRERQLLREAPQAVGHRVEITSSEVYPSHRSGARQSVGSYSSMGPMDAHSQVNVVESVYANVVMGRWGAPYVLGN